MTQLIEWPRTKEDTLEESRKGTAKGQKQLNIRGGRSKPGAGCKDHGVGLQGQQMRNVLSPQTADGAWGGEDVRDRSGEEATGGLDAPIRAGIRHGQGSSEAAAPQTLAVGADGGTRTFRWCTWKRRHRS